MDIETIHIDEVPNPTSGFHSYEVEGINSEGERDRLGCGQRGLVVWRIEMMRRWGYTDLIPIVSIDSNLESSRTVIRRLTGDEIERALSEDISVEEMFSRWPKPGARPKLG